MAAHLTTDELLRRLVDACQSSSRIESYAIDAIDEDTLCVHVFLTDPSFINVFYNIVTDKIAFAWIKDGKRIYGKDNAKIGWHVHPLELPDNHLPCDPTDLLSFLREVEKTYPKI